VAPRAHIPTPFPYTTLFRSTTRNDLYDVTPAGLPSEDEIADAFRDATCAQVAAMIAADIDPDAGIAADSAEVASSKILSGSVTRSEEHTSELQSRFDLVCRL